MKIAKVFLVAIVVCLGISNVGFAKVPNVQPMVNTTTNNTTLIYSGIVAIPMQYFFIGSPAYVFTINNIDPNNCNTVTHTYVVAAAISDTTATHNSRNLENVCGLADINLSAAVGSVATNSMTIKVSAVVDKSGYVTSGLFDQNYHSCWNPKYINNSINGAPLVNHAQIDVYCVPK